MFAHNERISDRQFKRLLTMELFGVTTVLLPGILCETVKKDGITALFGGMVLVLIYGFLLKTIAKCSGRSIQQTLKQKHKIIYEIFLFVMLIQMILMGIWVLTLVAEMSRDILLQGTDIRMILLTFGAVSVLGAIKGMESRGRMAEVLYWFILLPFLVLLALAARKVNPDYMPPLLTESTKTIAHGSYEVFIVFQGVTLGFFALPYMKNRMRFWKSVRCSVVLNTVFCFLLMGVSIGIFGLKGAASQKWLAVNLMTTPDFPGGLVERLDVLMVTIWIVALFFFVSGCMFHGGKMAGRLFHAQHERTGILIIAAFIIVGAIVVGNQEYSYYVYLNYMKYIGVPLLGLVLLLILWKLRPAKAIRVMACMVIILCLTGCAKGVELEDREFVLSLGVDWNGEKIQFYYDTSSKNADSSGSGSQSSSDSSQDGGQGQGTVKIEADGFYEIQSVYGQQSDKYLDYNHLKSIIIGKNLASDSHKLIEFLQYIERNELFARNTKLFFAKESLDDVFALCQEMDTSLGEYLENIYVDSNYYVEGQSSSIGALINHWHDSEEILMVPVLKAQDKRPLIECYAMVRGVQWIEQIENQEANLIFLANGVNVQTDLTVDKQYAIKLQQVSREINFTDGAFILADVTIKMRGTIVNEEVTSEKKKREIAKELNSQLEGLYRDSMTDWKELDVFHLYRALGSHSRELWEKYQDKRPEFNKDIQINVKVESTIM